MATLKFNAYDYEEGIVKSLAYNYDPLHLYTEASITGQTEEGIFANDSFSETEGTDVYDGSDPSDYVITPWMQLPVLNYQNKLADLLYAKTDRPYPAPTVHYRRIRVEDKMQSAPYVYIPNKVLDELCNNHSIGLDDPRRVPISFDEYYYKITAVAENPMTQNAYDYETQTQKTFKAFTVYFSIYDKNDNTLSSFSITQALNSNPFGVYGSQGILFIPAVLTDFYSKYWAAQIDEYPRNQYYKWSTGSYGYNSIVSMTCISIPEDIILEKPINSGNYYRVKSISTTNLTIPRYFAFSTAQRISSSLAFNVNDGYLKVFDTNLYPVFTIEDENGNDIQMTGTEVYSTVAPSLGLAVPVRIFDTSGTNKLLQYVGAYENSPAPEPEPTPDPDNPPTPDPQPDPDDDTDPVPTDNLDGTNGYTIEEINALHPENNSLFCMNAGALGRFRHEIENVCYSDLWRTLSQTFASVKVTDVISKIIEYPFNPQMFLKRGVGYDYLECCVLGPAPSNSRLTLKEVTHSTSTLTGSKIIRWYIRRLLGTMSDEDADAYAEHVWGIDPAHDTITVNLPSTFEPDYFNRLNNRWHKIDYGKKEIVRRQENSLDFEATDYILVLPLCNPISLNSFDLFRSDGDPYTGTRNKCVLSIEGILDIETGDILFNVYVSSSNSSTDRQLIIQQTSNIATERQIIGTDTTAEVREVASSIKNLIQSTASAALGQTGSAVHGAMDSLGSLIKSEVSNQPITRGTSDGGAKLVSNMLPYIDIYYPIPVIPAKRWKKEMGLTSAAYSYAQGYNKYAKVQRILDKTGTMSEKEIEDLTRRLEGGFVYYGNTNPWN